MQDPDVESNLVDKLKEYLSLRFNIAYLTMVEKSSLLMASAISTLIAIIFFTMFFLFASLALSYYLSELFGSFFLGFGTVALFYLFFGLLLLLIRKPVIEKPLVNTFVRQMCKDIELEDDGK